MPLLLPSWRYHYQSNSNDHFPVGTARPIAKVMPVCLDIDRLVILPESRSIKGF